MGLWNPKEGPFNWAKAFGGRVLNDPEKGRYNSRRLWAVMNRFSPSLKLDPEEKELPLFVKPDTRLKVSSMMDALRDHFEGTPYDVFLADSGEKKERPVCVPSTVHSAVIEMLGARPSEMTAVLWGCLGSPMTAPYIPHYVANTALLSDYMRGGAAYQANSAFWKFRTITNLTLADYSELAPVAAGAWSELEQTIFSAKFNLECNAAELYKDSHSAAKAMLTSFSNTYDALAYATAGELEGMLHTKIAEDRRLYCEEAGLER
jgi:dipeptidase